MSETTPAPAAKGKGIFKMVLLVVFIVAAIIVVTMTPVKNYLTKDAITGFLDAMGVWKAPVFVGVYAAGVCLFVPGTLLTAVGAGIFGSLWGFVWVYLGALVGSSIAFVIGRTLGREFAANLIGDKLKKYDDAIERNGFATVLYLRLVYFPFTPMNFGMGLTKVRFIDYFAGTALGIAVGTFVLVNFLGVLINAFKTGDWASLLTLKAAVSLVLFVGSFFIPMVVKKIKGED